MEAKIFFIFLFICQCIENFATLDSEPNSFFTLVGPRTVRHKGQYQAFLSARDFHDNEKLTISLSGMDGEDIESQEIKVGFLNQTISFDLSESETIQNYNLSAKIGDFEQSVEIITIPRRYSIFVQTDKPIYKPGDKIRFRVFVIDSDLKLFPAEKIEIKISDVAEVVKIIDVTDSENFKNGVFKDVFDIATEPRMGKWNFKVVVNEEEDFATIHNFEVKEYVLPRFEVIAETKHDVTQNEGFIRLTVYANYTFGEFVKGEAVITARVIDPLYPNDIQQTTSKTVPIEFKKLVEFNIATELKIVNSIRPYLVKFNVEFEEELTKQKLQKEVEVRIYRNGEYNLQLVKEQKRFKPGFPFKVKAIVRKYDGTLADDRHEGSVRLQVNYHFKPLMCSSIAQSASLNRAFESNKDVSLKKGVAEFTIEVPENTTAFSLNAKFKDEKAEMNVFKQVSDTDEYLMIESGTPMPKIGKDFIIKTFFKGEPEILYYIVVNKTGIAHKGTYENTFKQRMDEKKSFIKFKATKFMAPQSSVIVYYFHPTGEIIYDSIDIKLDPPLPTSLDVKISPNKAKPGESCKVSIKSSPDSTVFLLGVDQSVTLLGTGNDITKERVEKDMTEYDKFNLTDLVIKGNDNGRYQDFAESNAFVITNAMKGIPTCLQTRIDNGENLEDVVQENNDESGLDDKDDDDDDTFDSEGTRIRKNFPETWIFRDFEIDDKKTLSKSFKVPDTISTFYLTAFSMNSEEGLGIASRQQITVVQEFFVKLYLPYSIRFGEVLKVDVTVFNYIKNPKKAVNVDVKMFNEGGEFEFVDATPSGGVCNIRESSDTHRTKSISVNTGSGAVTYFLIRALKMGEITLKVKATTSSKHSDLIEKKMLIEAEGLTVSENKAILIDMREKSVFTFHFDLPIVTDNVIWDSIMIEASVIGDVLGPAIQNVQNLIQMPSGCSEQQFKSWIPNIAAIRYLKAIGKLTKDYETKGESYLSTGYQQLLGRRKPDGSYSLWGETGDSSVWLTAYVVKLLAHAKEFIPVNDRYVVDALNFIKSKQLKDGSFLNQTRSYIYMKTRSQLDAPLVAFVAIAFLENDEYKTDNKEFIDKCLNYLSSKTTKMDDNFAIAIAAYALALDGRHEAEGYIEDLKNNAIRTNDQWYWYRERKQFSSFDSPSIRVEIAAYAIMAFVKSGKATEALPIMNWLVTQRNSAGGFYSTTDTVVGLQALVMIATEFYSKEINMNVKMGYEKNKKVEFTVNSANALQLQIKELEKYARVIRITANGNGLAFLQVAFRYNTVLEDPERKFDLTVAVQPNTNPNLLHLVICASFIADDNRNSSAMTLIEVYLPSGYIWDSQTADLVKSQGVRRTETTNQNTIITLYFDNISTTKTCPHVKAFRKYVVAARKQSVVKIYDYYSKNQRASAFYLPSGEKPCGF